ncbi:IPT/TIG domain-containing protein [Planosporangium sp. 12N6]|uniref:IPT/TIG domain-containing protein n=1 Tax=Planosporangium spinosum TaxID=3402278 RepID=UPI003CE79433
MLRRLSRRWWTVAAIGLLPLASYAVVAALPAAAATPTDGGITLSVRSARTVGPAPEIQKGDPVTHYKWLITSDDVGNPHDDLKNCLPARAGVASTPNFADTCQWPSVRATPGAVPVVAQGDDTTLNATTSLGKLPVGKYLISVTADGYKIDGQHFTVTGGKTTPVAVTMQPYPLPLGTIRLRVFNDNAPVDGTYEVGAERGLAGFTAYLSDVLGQVSVDYYGNPLCTQYVHGEPDATHPKGAVVFEDGKPKIAPGSVGRCVSDSNGDVVIENLGPNRYAAQVVAPTGQVWAQTTTLEGSFDWDIWVQENDTGYDTEQTLGGERVPYVDFGFVAPTALPANPATTGEIVGTAVQGRPYVGGQGGASVPETGVAGAKIAGPVPQPWVALSALGNGDQMVYLGRGGADGKFDIKNVPDGDYQMTIWDAPQELILWSFNVTVRGGQKVDVGTKMLVGWFTHIRGTIFVDKNGNGRRDPGEAGVPRFPVSVKERDNSFMDQYTNSVTTDNNGYYDIKETYPLSKWLVLEAFHTRYKTTGITYQADNEPTPTTLKGAAVDLNFLPIIGLGGTVDWGVQPYAGDDNGGIAGTVTYDTTRNELDAANSVTENYQPGIPGIKVHLYAVERDDNGDPVRNRDGSLKRGPELADAYTSETWEAGRGCTARMWDGNPLTDQQALPDFGRAANQKCVEAPMMGVQFAPSENDPNNFGQTVNGNYAFTDSTLNLYPPGDPKNPGPAHDLALYAPLPDGQTQQLVPDDYIVAVDIPDNPVGGGKMYQVTREEDVNVFDGDGYLPQDNFPPTPAEAGNPPDGATPQPDPGSNPSQGNGIISECAGANHTVHVTNPAFLAGGGSPFEGQRKPLCDAKLVEVRAGQTSAPNFNLFTEVPLPTHFWGLTINDLGLSHDKRSIEYGEAEGLPNVPMGIYDFAGRLVDTVDTDFNGFYEAIEPSTGTYNCPVPAGPCPNMYRFVGNDPGQPGHLNKNYNPRYRTIATNFQAWPGLFTVTDTAPTQVGMTALTPGSTQVGAVDCDIAGDAPQLFSVSKPYLRTTDTNREITIKGVGFGSSRGTVTVSGSLGTVPAAVTSWNDREIKVIMGASASGVAATLSVTNAAGKQTVNGLSFQFLGTATGSGTTQNPKLRQVNPPASAVSPGEKTYTGVQSALDDAAAAGRGAEHDLVVVWPNRAGADNPFGAYLENVVIHSSVRLQGVGPGGQYADGSYVPGSVLDGRGFGIDNDSGTAWLNLVGSLAYAGPTEVPDGAVVTVLARQGQFNASTAPTVNGFRITGGNQSDFPGNVNEVVGGIKTPYGASGAVITQGGGVYLHAEARFTQITDNVIVGNSGSYGGAVRVGTPYANTHNANVKIARNQIRDNGGTNLAGGIAIFTGSNGYSVDHNSICGNFSAEYGGGISHYGLSPQGSISANRVYLNESYDEAGGIMIAGELPPDPNRLSPGSGAVTVDGNTVQANLAGDDGGGLRMLQVGNFPITVTNNVIAGNISTHEGGGIALDDATDVRIVNNTVMDNITTATAITSNGTAAPAGLSVAENSVQLQATLPPGSPTFSSPKLFNNIFWNNRAGSWNGLYVSGIGAKDAPAGDPINYWDMGSADGVGPLTPTNSVLGTTNGTTPSGTNKVGVNPKVVAPFLTSVSIETSRTFPAFRQAVIIVQHVAGTQMGNYHLAAGSPALDSGAHSRTFGTVTVTAPGTDIDGDIRDFVRPDIGADEVRAGLPLRAAPAPAPPHRGPVPPVPTKKK